MGQWWCGVFVYFNIYSVTKNFLKHKICRKRTMLKGGISMGFGGFGGGRGGSWSIIIIIIIILLLFCGENDCSSTC
jgi:hypothetical protein